MKPLIVSVALLLPTYGVAGPATEELTLMYKVGEELMIDCEQNNKRCVEYLAFIEDFNKDVSYLTTFKKSLARHKKRVARGGKV